jgi:hypothetical protein
MAPVPPTLEPRLEITNANDAVCSSSPHVFTYAWLYIVITRPREFRRRILISFATVRYTLSYPSDLLNKLTYFFLFLGCVLFQNSNLRKVRVRTNTVQLCLQLCAFVVILIRIIPWWYELLLFIWKYIFYLIYYSNHTILF